MSSVEASDDKAQTSPMDVTDETSQEEQAEHEPFSIQVLPMVAECQREHGLRHNDFMRYRQYCTRRLYRLRKSLGLMNGKKRFAKKTVEPESVADVRHLHMALMQAERAWAYAMEDKQHLSENNRKKYHAMTRLKKAAKHAQQLQTLATIRPNQCDQRTELEISAYVNWIEGSLKFEKKEWEESMKLLQSARVIYDNLSQTVSDAITKEVYNSRVNEIDASIRFCSYNLKQQGMDVNDLVEMRANLTHSSGMDMLAAQLDTVLSAKREQDAESLTHVTWFGRKVAVSDSDLRISIQTARGKEEELKKGRDASDYEGLMELYDKVLMAHNDSLKIVDDLLSHASADQTDAKTANLRFLRAYITYLKLQSTIDRNEAMADHLHEAMLRDEASPGDLVRLFDIMMQTLTTLTGLDVVQDEDDYIAYAEAQQELYRALRCFYIAESYRKMNKVREALALYQRAEERISTAQSKFEECDTEHKASSDRLKRLKTMTRQNRCTVHAAAFLAAEEEARTEETRSQGEVLSHHLDQFNSKPAILAKPNLVEFPPAFEVVPCKPLFFDLAGSAIQFPNIDHRIEKKQEGGMVGRLINKLWWS